MKRILSNVPLVRRELDSCLFSATASILRYRGWDDLMSLGARWEFVYPLNGIVRAEYFIPVRDGSLMEVLLPDQGVTSSWRTTDEPKQAWEDLTAAVMAGHPTPVAVDNYYLPYRPAYGDVHSNHLVLVYGIDDDLDVVYVIDATPPAFRGPLATKHLRNARASRNPDEGDRDFFFTRSPIAHGQLDIRFPAEPWAPTEETIRKAIRRNLVNLSRTTEDSRWLTGTAGIYRLADLIEHSNGEHCDGLFIVSGALLCGRARHAVFLKRAAALLRIPRLAEIGRSIDEISYQWAAARILASRELRERPDTACARLATRLRRIAAAEADAARQLEEVIA